jgi:hypothetical protein
VHRDPTRSAEVKETFQGFRINKLRRKCAIVHRAIAERSRRSRRPFGRSEFEEAQEGKCFQRTLTEVKVMAL